MTQIDTHTAHILNQDGDIIISWNHEDPKEQDEMHDLFYTLIAQGYEAYAIEPNSSLMDLVCGSTQANQLMTDFDNDIGKILIRKRVVLTPAVQGGYPKSGMSEGRL